MDHKLNLDDLPPEIITQFLIRLSLKDLINYCLTSKTANEYCESDAFWKDKYRHDFGLQLPTLVEGKKWIDAYREWATKNSPISAGQYHYAMIDNQGILYMGGDNKFFQLGNGTNDNTGTPIRLTSFTEKIISVSCGGLFTIAITENGKIYGWGTFHNRKVKVPTLVPDLENYKAIKVSCGERGWAAILDNGSVYYSLGLMYEEQRIAGIMKLEEDVTDISISAGQFGMVTSAGNLYVFGMNFGGEVIGLTISPGGKIVLEARDSSIGLIHFPMGPDEISKNIKIKSVSLSMTHIMALSVNGDIFSWGGNEKCQLGLKMKSNAGGTLITPQKIIAPVKFAYIGTNSNISYAITTRGKLYIWGGDHYVINHELRLKPLGTSQVIGIAGNFIIKSPLEINIGHRVNYVAFGSDFAIAVTEDGMVNYMGEANWGPS